MTKQSLKNPKSWLGLFHGNTFGINPDEHTFAFSLLKPQQTSSLKNQKSHNPGQRGGIGCQE